MRWTKRSYQVGDIREVGAILWFPKTIGSETRWLEYGVWEIARIRNFAGSERWVATKWVTPQIICAECGETSLASRMVGDRVLCLRCVPNRRAEDARPDGGDHPPHAH